MVYSYLRTIKNGACVFWLKNSRWAKYLIVFSVMIGILAGASISGLYAAYNDISQPKIVTIDKANVHQSVRALEVTITNSYPKQCEKLSDHILHQEGSNIYYNLTSGIGGSNYDLSTPTYTINLNIPQNIPAGNYDYNIRAIYMCNFFGLTLYYPAQTTPIKLHLD